MAAPTLQAQGAIAAVTTGNLAITLPAYTTNDIVVITTVGWVPNTTTGTNTQSLASPWTKYSPDITTITASIIDAEYAFWWARATSASSLGTTVTITRPTSWDTGTDTCWAGRAYVISGCETTGDPYDQLTATAISTAANPAFPAVTVNAGERNVIVFMAKADNTATPTAATGYTVGTEVTTTTGTDAGFQSYSDVTNTSLSAVTPTGGTAPAQGGSVYWGVSFRKPLVTITRTGSDTGTGTESASRVLKALRTASDTGSGTESATGKKLVVFQRTASDTGTGTESASRLIRRLRTASDTGTGTESASRVVARVRTGSDTGTGSESAIGNIVPGTPAHQRTASDTGVGSESAVGVFWSILARTGSDTGSGSESASRVLVKVRTASDTGSGSETASRVIVKTRSATASGAGTESASFAFVRARTGSATGVGGETASRVLVALRTASSTGSGASSVVSAKALFRTGSDTGVGTETAVGCKLFTATATASGTGTETPANWSKSLIFRPPSDDQFAWAEYSDPSADAWFLSKLQRGSRARNIYKLTSGTYTNTDPLDPTLVDKVYYGGHQHFVTEQEKADLIAAGYTVT